MPRKQPHKNEKSHVQGGVPPQRKRSGVAVSLVALLRRSSTCRSSAHAKARAGSNRDFSVAQEPLISQPQAYKPSPPCLLPSHEAAPAPPLPLPIAGIPPRGSRHTPEGAPTYPRGGQNRGLGGADIPLRGARHTPEGVPTHPRGGQNTPLGGSEHTPRGVGTHPWGCPNTPLGGSQHTPGGVRG